MIKMTILLSLIVTGAFAQIVVLDQDRVTLSSNETQIEKIGATGDIVDLIVPVPTIVTKCEPGHSRTETRANGARCGYDTVYTGCYPRGPRYPRYPGPRYPRGPRYPGPRGPRGPRGGRGGIHVRVGAKSADQYCYRQVPRVCSYTVCDRTYTETEIRNQKFELTFEDYDRDEVFDFKLDEYGNVTLLPTQTSPSCTKLIVYGDKPNVTGAKISIKNGWFNRSCQ